MKLQNQLREFRAERNWTYTEAGKFFCIPANSYRVIELGKRKPGKHLPKIELGLGLDDGQGIEREWQELELAETERELRPELRAIFLDRLDGHDEVAEGIGGIARELGVSLATARGWRGMITRKMGKRFAYRGHESDEYLARTQRSMAR